MTKLAKALAFKWADNCLSGEWGGGAAPSAEAFSLHGDAGPNGRFNFRLHLTP
jgi:hypothetical protein